MGIGQALSTAREAADRFAPTPESLKAAALNSCRGAIETCKGSGSIKTELLKIKDSCINLPVGMAANNLKACSQLLTLQPVKATCTAAKGLTDACKDAAKIMVSPVPTGIAAVKGTAKAGITVAKLPVTAPIAAYRLANRGLDKVLSYMGPSAVPPPANENATPPDTPAEAPRAA